MEQKAADRAAGRMLGKMRRSARKWAFFESGTKVALAVSGGLDSLVMVELMSRFGLRWFPRLEMIALHIRLDARGTGENLNPEITEYIRSRGVELVEIDPRQEIPPEEIHCFECSRIRRRSLFEEAEKLGYPVVALGHHADDLVETWLMSLFYSGTPDLLLPMREYFEGAVSVIRPMIELQRRELKRLARLTEIPEPMAPCPLETQGRRESISRALAQLRPDEQRVRRHLFHAALRTEKKLANK